MPTIAELEARAEILARRNAELEQELAKAEKLAAKNEVCAMQSEGAAEKAIVESHIRAAALEAGSTAEPTEGSDRGPLDDVVRRMMIDHDWKADSQGKPFRPLPDGKLDYTSPAELMKKLRTDMPPLFPKHQGAAATGANGIPAGTGPNPWSKKNWNQYEQNQYQIAHGEDAADALARSVGSSLYATHPPAE
jgi:hypothetical protein